MDISNELNEELKELYTKYNDMLFNICDTLNAMAERRLELIIEKRRLTILCEEVNKLMRL